MTQKRRDKIRHRTIAQKRALVIGGPGSRESLRDRISGLSIGLNKLSRTPKALAELLAEDARVQQARFAQLEETFQESILSPLMPKLEPVPIPEIVDEYPEAVDEYPDTSRLDSGQEADAVNPVESVDTFSRTDYRSQMVAPRVRRRII